MYWGHIKEERGEHHQINEKQCLKVSGNAVKPMALKAVSSIAKVVTAYLIFVLFSPHAQFLNEFFSTQKCVNRNKIDFAPIQRKWQQSRFCDKSAWIVTKKIVSTFNMWRNVSTWQILLHISPHDMIFLFIYHAETYLQLSICHVETLLHMTICHMENFLHMTNFFSTTTGCDGCDKYQVCQRKWQG